MMAPGVGSVEHFTWKDKEGKPMEGTFRVTDGFHKVEGKWKLSQNRSDADIAGAIEGLEATGEPDVSAAMRDLGRGG